MYLKRTDVGKMDALLKARPLLAFGSRKMWYSTGRTTKFEDGDTVKFPTSFGWTLTMGYSRDKATGVRHAWVKLG